jgi:hypothetical protein
MNQTTRPGCTGKIAYPSRAAAERARKGLATKPTSGRKKRRRKTMAEQNEAYSCECGGWHLGRARTRPGPGRPAEGPNSLAALARRAFAAIERLPE